MPNIEGSRKPRGKFREPINLKTPLVPFTDRGELIRGQVTRRKDQLHAARLAILSGLELEEVVDSAEAVILSPFGSTHALSAAIDLIASREGQCRIWGLPYGYPLATTLAEENNLQVHLLSDSMEDPRQSLTRIKTMPESMIRESFFVVDYPTNPTGGTFHEVLEEVVTYVGDRGGRCIVDLAYCGYLRDKAFQQLAQTILSHGGIVAGSLSKLVSDTKSGFAIVPNDTIKNCSVPDEASPLRVVDEDLLVYQSLFSAADGEVPVITRLRELGDQYEAAKPVLIEMLESNGLFVPRTDDRTPILLVVSEDPSFHNRLQKAGVVTYPSSHFESTPDGLGNRAVRITVPLEPGVVDKVNGRISQSQ